MKRPDPAAFETFAALETVRADQSAVRVPLKHHLPQLPMGDAVATPDIVSKSILGEGGMGIVYAAEQRSLRRDVAVKTLRSSEQAPHAVDNFVREAWITGWLSHPNIPAVHALGVDAKGRPTLVMEQIRGETWERRLSTRTHSAGISSALDADLLVFEQVCHALEYAHSRGVIHRDLKPANVMIGPFGEVLALDWGLAVAISDEASTRILPAREVTGVSGTPAYMAPEMARGDSEALSVRTDVYLLGALLYEVALGFPPHLGGTLQATLRRAALGALPRFPEELPPDLQRILERAMAPAPSDRYPAVKSLRLAVADYRTHREARSLVAEAERHGVAIAEGSLTDAADHFQKSRFAFELAARMMGSHAAVQEGLSTAMEAMARRYVERGDAHAALALLDEAGLEAADLRRRIRDELALQQAKESELETLREVAKHVDVASGASMRVRAFLLVALLWGAPSFLFGRLVNAGLLSLDYVGRYGVLGVSIVALAAAISIEHRAIFPNPINRRIVLFGVTIGAMVVFNAALCQALGVPFATSLVLEMFFTQFVLTILGIFVRPELVAAAFMHAPWIILAVVFREHELELLGVAVVLANLTMAVAERRLHLDGPKGS